SLMLPNLVMTTNILSAALKTGVKRLIYVASSCVYPRQAPQLLKVESVLTGRFEPTNEAYAVAKTAGLKLLQAMNHEHKTHFCGVIPANPYGPGDSFDPNDAHVITALIRRMHDGRTLPSIDIWGTGNPRRDFL